MLENVLFYAYYWACLVVLEERLWGIVCREGVVKVWRWSWFSTRQFVAYHVVAGVLFGVVLPGCASELRAACLGDLRCRSRLRRDRYGLYDDNDAQWRSFRSSLPLLAVVAVGLALFFLPIWLGVPMDADLVRSRWWFRGWI